MIEYSGAVAHSGEGQWTVDEARELGIPVPVLKPHLSSANVRNNPLRIRGKSSRPYAINSEDTRPFASNLCIYYLHHSPDVRHETIITLRMYSAYPGRFC